MLDASTTLIARRPKQMRKIIIYWHQYASYDQIRDVGKFTLQAKRNMSTFVVLLCMRAIKPRATGKTFWWDRFLVPSASESAVSERLQSSSSNHETEFTFTDIEFNNKRVSNMFYLELACERELLRRWWSLLRMLRMSLMCLAECFRVFLTKRSSVLSAASTLLDHVAACEERDDNAGDDSA